MPRIGTLGTGARRRCYREYRYGIRRNRRPFAKNRPLGRILFGVVAVVALVALGRQFGSLLDQFVVWVEGLGAIGPLVFMFGYAAATVAFVPGAVLSLAAGATFGLGSGVVYVMIGATAGAALAFLLARYVARDAIEQRIARERPLCGGGPGYRT